MTRIGLRRNRSTQTPAGRLKSRNGSELDDGQCGDLECRRVQDDDRDERDREAADLRAELADSFGRPEFEEVRVAPEAARRPELHDRSLSSEPAFRAGARSIRTSPDTVFANSSTSVRLAFWHLLGRHVRQIELRNRRAADSVRVDEDARAAADADADVTRHRAQIHAALVDGVDALIAGDGVRSDRVAGVADEHVAGDELDAGRARRPSRREDPGGGVHAQHAAGALDLDVAAGRLDACVLEHVARG